MCPVVLMSSTHPVTAVQSFGQQLSLAAGVSQYVADDVLPEDALL